MSEQTVITDYCPVPRAKPYLRPLLIVFGWLCVVLGTIGVVTPGMPTTIFIILAAWAFARSSARFHQWLYGHRLFGPTLINWENHRVIPVKAKIMAVSMMGLSVTIMALIASDNLMVPAILAAGLSPIALYIVTRASRVPA
ncbi:MAG: YbaN family protein [Rhodospirillales bacterium]|nr:YbaN family protein [Rhodospirillales bacterium]